MIFKRGSTGPVLFVGFEPHVMAVAIGAAAKAGMSVKPVANDLDVVVTTAVREKAVEIYISESGLHFDPEELKTRLKLHPDTRGTKVRVVSMDSAPKFPWPAMG